MNSNYYGHMPQSYNTNLPYISNNNNYNDERLIAGGGFAFPFLLGGVTGAALAPAFWRPGYGYRPRPMPYYPPYYGPYPRYY